MRNNEESATRIELMQGTLDMLILRTLVLGPAHGHEIARHIQRTTDNVLQVEHGSLYPALHRLRSEEHTSELQSHSDLVCRLLLEKKNDGPQLLNHMILETEMVRRRGPLLV